MGLGMGLGVRKCVEIEIELRLELHVRGRMGLLYGVCCIGVFDFRGFGRLI